MRRFAGASPALQPVLNHIRAVVHEAAPETTETVKWGMPFFEVGGVILANMGIFKQHGSFGFWSRSMTEYLASQGIPPMEGAGSFGKLTSLADLPPHSALVAHVREAVSHIRNGKWQSPLAARPRAPGKPEIPMPADFAAALQRSAAAKERFEASAPSCRREYLEWIATAKREETRTVRINEAIARIAEGKQRHWQHQK